MFPSFLTLSLSLVQILSLSIKRVDDLPRESVKGMGDISQVQGRRWLLTIDPPTRVVDPIRERGSLRFVRLSMFIPFIS